MYSRGCVRIPTAWGHERIARDCYPSPFWPRSSARPSARFSGSYPWVRAPELAGVRVAALPSPHEASAVHAAVSLIESMKVGWPLFALWLQSGLWGLGAGFGLLLGAVIAYFDAPSAVVPADRF